jgi:small-conductance mechanosensitive channel/CRP-like cAMP-binding protein
MKKLTLPLVICALLFLAYGVVWWTRPELREGSMSLRYLLAMCLVSASIVIVRALSYVYFDVLFQKRKGREAPALLRMVLSIVAYSALFLLIYSQVLHGGGFEIVATSTVVSVIIGLALQDTLGNFFAGISIHVEQPFHIGDAIRIGDVTGRVEAVTWRTTTIRTNNNTVIIFPNSRVARDPMEVYPFNNLNRHVLRFPAPYSVAPQRVIPMMQEAVRSVPNVAPERTPIVRIADFAESSITYEVLFWIRDYMLVPDTDAKIRERTWYIYHRSDIEIPFPTRHLLVEKRGSKSATQSADYESIIESVKLFEPLTSDERTAVARAIVEHTYAPGEVILRGGEPGDSMFVVHRGKVEVRLPSTNGGMQQVAVLEAGNFFGEISLFTGEPRTADVYAVGEVEILEIRKAIIEQLLGENEKLAEAFSHKIAERQAELAEYSRSVVIEDHRTRSESILRRIKRFFSLS